MSTYSQSGHRAYCPFHRNLAPPNTWFSVLVTDFTLEQHLVLEARDLSESIELPAQIYL